MAHVLWWWWWERERRRGGGKERHTQTETDRQRQRERGREREEGREGERKRDVSCNHTRRNCNHLNVESNSQHISVHSTRHLVAVRSKTVSEERARRGLRFQYETTKAEYWDEASEMNSVWRWCLLFRMSAFWSRRQNQSLRSGSICFLPLTFSPQLTVINVRNVEKQYDSLSS